MAARNLRRGDALSAAVAPSDTDPDSNPPRLDGAPRQGDVSRAEVDARRRSVLSAQANPFAQQLVRLFLPHERYALDQVQTGGEALGALGSKQYELMLLDLHLPDMDGLEVARRVRTAEAGAARLSIVAMSAGETLDANATRASGVDAVVAKPFTADRFRAAVARALRGAAPIEEAAAPTLDDMSPTIAAMTQAYGHDTVALLLRSLLDQLSRLEGPPAASAEVLQAAHAIKGAAASLGFDTVAEACAGLEAACRRGADADLLLQRARLACGQVRDAIVSRLQAA